jgi:hypothetical protein
MANSEEILTFASDKERLDYIKDLIMKQIQTGTINLKVGDLLKILEIQKKLSTDAGAEQKFWELIEQIRKEELRHE